MITITTITVLLLATFLIAGWPLLALPRFRQAMQLVGGTCCIWGGAGLMSLLAGGLIALPGLDSKQVAAQEKSAETAAALSDNKSDSKPAETIASKQTEINLGADEAAAGAKTGDDVKIEALPEGTIEIPPGRPDWVKEAKGNLNGPVHTIYVTSGPYKLERDAQRALEKALKDATDEYVGDQLNSPLAANFVSPGVREIREKYVKQTYPEVINFESVGPMDQIHALLQFDQNFRNEIRNHWVANIAESRLWQTGLIAGGALLLLGSVFSYFRLDNATRGYYTGRLQFMTAAAILAIIAAVVASALQLTWL